MQTLPFLCLLCAILASSVGVVYKPCDLVETIKNMTVLEDASKLPLVVCIAGYRNYNTSYRLENPRNSTGYYGIFGLHNNDVNRTLCAGPGWSLANLLDADIEDDLRCLKQIILSSPLNLEFYRGMCSQSMVRNIPCPITNYVQADVFDPLDKSLFEKAYKKGGLPIPPSLPPSTTPPPCCCPTDKASNYWALYITVPAILIVMAFFAVKIAMKRRADQQDANLINS